MSCYVKTAGETLPTDLLGPCAPVTDGQPVQCCDFGSKCMDDGMCLHNGVPPENTTGYYLSGCSDPTYSDPSCPPFCADEVFADVVWVAQNASWRCCGADATGHEISCDEPQGPFFQAPAPPALKELAALGSSAFGAFSRTIFATGSSSSSAAAPATASASSQPSAATTAPLSTAVTTASTTAAAHSTQSTSSPAASVPAPTSTSQSADLSSAAAAGLGVSLTVLIAAALAAGLWLWRRKKQREKWQVPISRPKSFDSEKDLSVHGFRQKPFEAPATEAHGNELPEQHYCEMDAHRQQPELPGDQRRAELHGDPRRWELHVAHRSCYEMAAPSPRELPC